MPKELTVEEKAKLYDEYTAKSDFEKFQHTLGKMKIPFTVHTCMGAIQTGGTPQPVKEGIVPTGPTKYTDIEQQQYNKILMLLPCFGDNGNCFIYFNDDKFVTKRIYQNNAK